MTRLGLLERLEEGPVICAEGYLFELERRGYVQAGPFVPEAVLDHPEVVAQLHRDFVHAGSDVVPAFTYYAHREKMRLVGMNVKCKFFPHSIGLFQQGIAQVQTNLV